MISTETQMTPATFSPGWGLADQLGDGRLELLPPRVHPCPWHLNKAWVTFLASALGHVPFADGLRCAGQGLKVRGEQEPRAPRHSKISSSDKKFGVRGWIFQRFGKWKPQCFYGVSKEFFSLLLRTIDWGWETARIFKKQERKIPCHAVVKLWPQGFDFILLVTHSMTLALFSLQRKQIRLAIYLKYILI